jgi:hypothetical protein
MRFYNSIKRRLADTAGAVTEEFSFLTVVALALVGVLLAFFKGGFLGGLLQTLFSNLFQHLINQIVGLFS